MGAALAAVLGISSFVPSLPQAASVGIDDAGLASGEYIHVDYARKKLICEPKQSASSHALIEQWQMPVGGLTYKVNTNSIPGGLLGPSDNAVKSAIAAAAATWTSAGAPSFTYGGETSNANNINDGENTISFGYIRWDVVGAATMRVSNGVVQEADIVLDSGSLWAVNSGSSNSCSGALGKFDVQNIMTHEFGHWVGAKHPRDDDGNDNNNGNKWRSMYSDIAPGELHKRTLTAGDSASIPGKDSSSSFSGTVTRAGDDDG